MFCVFVPPLENKVCWGYRTDTSPTEPTGRPRPSSRLTMATNSLRIIMYLNASEKFVEERSRL